MTKTKVAFIYDFDGTLSPGNMQEFGFIQAIGKNKSEFWEKNEELSERGDASAILCYMYLMLHEARFQDISLNRDSFRNFGRKIELFKGVQEWFSLINRYGEENDLEIKHYINSSGLKEMIEGTPIAKEFEQIYACSYLYDADNVAYWPAVAVDYTTKTQFLFKINKGIEKVSDSIKVNEYVDDRNRKIPFQNMIYFGDGATDIPCMKMVKDHGGHAIAVYGDDDKKKTAFKLIKEGRVNFACPANYEVDGDIYAITKRILDKIKADNSFGRLLDIHKNRASK